MPLFINPNIHPKSQWSFVTKHMALQPPMSIGFIAGYLRFKFNTQIKIMDEIIEPIGEIKLKNEIENLEQPKIVCITSMTIQIGRAHDLAHRIKKIDPNVTVILGGIHPTVLPDESLLTGNVDIVVRYEGEETLVEIYDSLKNKIDVRNIKGISYIDKNKNICHNPVRMEMNLEKQPLFPYDLFEEKIKYYNRFGSLSISRGCPYNCIFCSNRTITGNKFRHFSLDWIENTIDLLINKYKQTYIMFLDDILIVNKDFFYKVTDMIIKKGFNRKAFFNGGSRADSVTIDIIKQCKKANFVFFGVGVETQSDRLLKILNKKESTEQITNAINLITGEGLMTSGAFIYGIPTETHEERKKTLKYALDLPIDNARFNVIIPYPGTEIYDRAKKENKLNIKKDYYNLNVQYYIFGDDLPYVPDNTNVYELIFDTMWANLRFYLRWRTIKRLKKSPITGGGTIHVPDRLKIHDYLHFIKFIVLIGFRLIKVFILSNLYKIKVKKK